MSFFIRKKSKNLQNLTKSVMDLTSGGANKPKNKDFKPRPTVRNKSFGGKRKSVDSKTKADGKRSRFNKEEEIESSSEEEELIDTSKSKESLDDSQEFYSAEEGDLDETAQEKKLRLAKLYLEEIEKQEKTRRENADVDDEYIASRLKEDVLESEGRLRKEAADQVEPDLDNIVFLSCSKYLKRSVTCLCITEDDEWIFSGSKDGHIIKWSIQEKKKVGIIKRKEVLSKKQKKRGKKLSPDTEDSNAYHSSSITAIAISSDGKYLASGDQDAKIVIWDPISLKKIHIFNGHRRAISGLTFRKKKHTLYSCSEDRSIRIWCLDSMGYVESLFGHQDAITSIDALTRERVVTGGGRDNTIRVWKIVEESQLVYNGHYNGNIDCIKLINEENFVSCGEDGLLCTWNVNRKKALFSVEKAHGCFKSFPESEIETPRWISALAAWTNTDLVASGSCDGFVRFWKCGEKFKTISPVFTVPVAGWINVMSFSAGTECSVEGLRKRTKFLVLGCGKEHRLGRWFQDFKDAKNGVFIIPFKSKYRDMEISSCNNINGTITPVRDDDGVTL